MPVIGTLTVNLEANTAEFTGDLGKASESAKTFGADAAEAGETADYSMTEARHGVMMLGEEFGVHLPRGLTTFIASLGPVGAAMEAAFPFLAIALGATLLIEHLVKMGEASEKLAETQAAAALTSEKLFANLGDKLLAVQIKTDELAGDHLGALRKQLELVDHQSLQELISAFGTLTGAADKTLAGLKTGWYSLSAGSKGASHALAEFKTDYEALLAGGKDKEAADLLKGTTDQAKAFLSTMNASKGTWFGDDKQLQSQQAFVKLLEDTASAQKQINQIASGEKKNDGAEAAEKEYEAEKKVYDEQQRGLEQRRKAEAEYAKEKTKASEKAIKEFQATAEAEIHATNDVTEGLKKAAEEQSKVQQKGLDEVLKGQEEADQTRLKAAQEAAKTRLALGKENEAKAAQDEIAAEQAFVNAEVKAFDQRIAALNTSDKNYANELQRFELEKQKIVSQGALKVQAIQDAALQQQYQLVSRAEDKIANSVASAAAKSIIEGKNMAQAFERVGAQMLESALTNALELETVQGRKRLGDARTAAADAFQWAGNPILGAVLAAGAFASVMAFEQGGEIPGSGAVPIIGHGGETVVTKALTDQVKNSNGGGSAQHHFTYAPQVHAVDSDGVDRMLQKHHAIFEAHMTSTLRKMNKRG